MSTDPTGVVRLDTAALLPDAWRHRSDDDIRAYNPALVRARGRLVVACRVDSGRDGHEQRRIAAATLDDELRVVPGSAVAVSDTVRDGGRWFYDPRLVTLGSRLFLHYHDNYQHQPNHQYLVELDPDTLEPRASARPLDLDVPRQVIEKNWAVFEHDGEALAIYTIVPHVVVGLDLSGSGPIRCRERHRSNWDVSTYAGTWGHPYGGAPPVRSGDAYVSFYHSHRPTSAGAPLRAWWPSGWVPRLPRGLRGLAQRIEWRLMRRRYYGGCYTFAARPPFEPRRVAAAPLLTPEAHPRPTRRRINPVADGVVYPAGAVVEADGTWLISYGVHDEWCALRRFDAAIVEGLDPDAHHRQ